MTLNVCRLIFRIGETDKIYPKKNYVVSLKGIEMRQVHSQWKMSRIGGFRRENLRHKCVLSLPVKIIILKSHTFFFFFFRFLCAQTGQQFGRDPATTYFQFSLKIAIFTWLILIVKNFKKREQFNIRENRRRFDIKSFWDLLLISLFDVPALIFIDIPWVYRWSTATRSATRYHRFERNVSTSVLIMKYYFNDTDFNHWV